MRQLGLTKVEMLGLITKVEMLGLRNIEMLGLIVDVEAFGLMNIVLFGFRGIERFGLRNTDKFRLTNIGVFRLHVIGSYHADAQMPLTFMGNKRYTNVSMNSDIPPATTPTPRITSLGPRGISDRDQNNDIFGPMNPVPKRKNGSAQLSKHLHHCYEWCACVVRVAPRTVVLPCVQSCSEACLHPKR